MVLEWVSPYLTPRKVEDKLEENLSWYPNVWMFKNVLGTQHRKIMNYSLSIITLVMVTDVSYHPKLTTNHSTSEFIIYFS